VHRHALDARLFTMARWVLLVVAAALLSACFTLTADPRALVLQPDGAIRALSLSCPPQLAEPDRTATAAPLDPRSIRVATWNIHKEGDRGWQKDLTTLIAGNDIVLLQETTLAPEMLDALHQENLRWIMASSFAFGGVDIGVLTASHAPPVASCTQRVVEPLIRLPKSAIISWFAVDGRAQRLAVANVHAINFSLSLDGYREQFTALADALATHEGPIILAGDLNTWSAARTDVVEEVARRLALSEVRPAEDKRSLFFGNQLDHILVRGLRVVSSAAIAVDSSDHNPVTATLEWPAE
jgi:endonuclease/exonuclease/phosphatase (EEP) superfamily protein YafD